MNQQPWPPSILFQKKMRIKNLKEIYQKKFLNSKLKGVDRLNSEHYSKKQIIQEIKTISRKSLLGQYNFSPYLENLKGKGRGKEPRILAVPTLRDRIAIYALKELLFEIFPECVPKKFANQYIREIKEYLESNQGSIGFFRTDLKNFYGSIEHNKLFDNLSKKIRSMKVIGMIRKAITRPIVPKVYRREDLSKYKISGIPQGLSISNILADIYLRNLDQFMLKNENIFYIRYVDDILIAGPKERLAEIIPVFIHKVESPQELQLTLNKDKTFSNCQSIQEANHSDDFEYLGYHFSAGKISPRKGSEEKFLRAIMALFSEYKHASKEIKSRKKRISIELLKKAFIFRLNEKLTGAISEKRKYGWIFYFIEMNDLSVLYRIDNIVSKEFNKIDDFEFKPPQSLKKIVRAYYFALHSPANGYIHNYNKYQTDNEKRDFLLENGYIKPGQTYKNVTIRKRYAQVRTENLSHLVQDETFVY